MNRRTILKTFTGIPFPAALPRRLLTLVWWVPFVGLSLAAEATGPGGAAADAFAITTPNGIQEGGYVLIGGIKQWIQIRGDDRRNPVLLCVHGGPGASWLARGALLHAWEKNLTVVQWDQRGSGRTFRENGEAEAAQMTIARMAQDGLEVAQYLTAHLQKKKILLLASSWGSILGLHMIQERPDLFIAYVANGQVVDVPGTRKLYFAHVLARARAAHNDAAVAELEKLGPSDDRILDKWAAKLPRGPESLVVENPKINNPPGFTEADDAAMKLGTKFSHRVLDAEIDTVDFLKKPATFAVPVFFFHGTADTAAPLELVERYLAAINAPHKELVRFEGGPHLVVLTRPDKFLEELLRRVRPLATEP